MCWASTPALSTPDVPLKEVNAGALLQHVSRIAYRGTQLYFGRDGVNRYDDPQRTYGVLYLGFELPTALMESVFHQHDWHEQTTRAIARAEVSQRMVRAVGVLEDLRLADLTAPGIMASVFGLNLEQLASRAYVHTQGISRQVHALLDDSDNPVFDGLLYPSRNNFPAACVALYDRAGPKVSAVLDIDLVDHIDWPAFVKQYRIAVVPVVH